MSKSKTIRNRKDLAAEVGANDSTIESISRRVYKDTSCGAWCATIDVKHVEESVLFDVIFHYSDTPKGRGWKVTVHTASCGREENPARPVRGSARFVSPQCLPPAERERLAEWLGVETDWLDADELGYAKPVPKKGSIGYEKGWVSSTRFIGERATEIGATIVYESIAECEVKVKLPVYRELAAIREVGVRVGSIVEGVDQETAVHELRFPFTAQEFWDALDEVEKEADEIWKATHGCEKCGPEDFESGGIPINPKCKKCHGEGAII